MAVFVGGKWPPLKGSSMKMGEEFMKWLVIVIIPLLVYGCNIVPKSVQYQKEEERLVGNTDTVNPIVEEIQVVLKSLEYDPGNTDGRMGQKTREAIKEFQESRGLKSTGYINKVTLTQIDDIRRVMDERDLDKSYTVRVRSAYSREKDSSSADFTPTTKEIQTALKNAGFDPGPIDGKFGPRTRQAVKEFQRTKGLAPDGKVGPKTWRKLGEYLKE